MAPLCGGTCRFCWQVELLVSYRTRPRVVDRGTPPRYGGYRLRSARTKTSGRRVPSLGTRGGRPCSRVRPRLRFRPSAHGAAAFAAGGAGGPCHAWLSARQLRCATAAPQPPAATLLPGVGSGVGWGPYLGAGDERPRHCGVAVALLPPIGGGACRRSLWVWLAGFGGSPRGGPSRLTRGQR